MLCCLSCLCCSVPVPVFVCDHGTGAPARCSPYKRTMKTWWIQNCHCRASSKRVERFEYLEDLEGGDTTKL